MQLRNFCAVLLLGCIGFAASVPSVPTERNTAPVKEHIESSPSPSSHSTEYNNKQQSPSSVSVGASGVTTQSGGSLKVSRKERLVITVEKTSDGAPGDPKCPEGTGSEGQKCAEKGALETLLSVVEDLKKYLGENQAGVATSLVSATQDPTRLLPVGTTLPVPAKVDTKLYRPDQTGCDVQKCKPPGCACSGEVPPGGLAVKDMPQFVMLTFDYTVHEGNLPFFYKLLGGSNKKHKATGCNVAATFFVTSDIDYVLVNELYAAGNEIALHSVSNRDDPDFWKSLTTDQWEREVIDQIVMLKTFGNITEGDMKGFRGPFLNTGGDNGFQTLHRNNVEYDNSLVHLRRRGEDHPLYPYTLDHGFKMPCVVEPCPRQPYPGLWVFPVNVYLKSEVVEGEDHEVPCPTGDKCEQQPSTAEDTFNYLRSQFEEYYNGNRAPFQLSLGEEWLKDPQRQDGYLRFVDSLLQKDDVHLVTMSEVLDFMRNPVPLSSYNLRHCGKHGDRPPCPMPTSCTYTSTPLGNFRYMRSCAECPPNFPWLHNPLGH
ncbi:unnamed protein product [Ixodes hexagonus]